MIELETRLLLEMLTGGNRRAADGGQGGTCPEPFWAGAIL